MNNVIITKLSEELNLKDNQIKAVLELLSEDATIPFIARYRKEATGNLNEDHIRIPLSRPYESLRRFGKRQGSRISSEGAGCRGGRRAPRHASPVRG